LCHDYSRRTNLFKKVSANLPLSFVTAIGVLVKRQLVGQGGSGSVCHLSTTSGYQHHQIQNPTAPSRTLPL